MKKFKKTRAKLSPEEERIGEGAPKGCENKERKKRIRKLIDQVDKQEAKKRRKK